MGEPAALCAAAVQAKSSASKDVSYIHDGNRGASNWKGSASQIHNRSAIPTFYWFRSTGSFAIYSSLKNYLHRKWNMDSYVESVKTIPKGYSYFFIISNAIRDPGIFKAFVRNQICSMRDIGTVFGLDSWFRLPNPPARIARALSHHCYSQFEILHNLGLEKLIVKSGEFGKSLTIDEGSADVRVHSILLDRVGKDVGYDFRVFERAEKEERGFNPDYLGSIIEFKKDGYAPPFVDQLLENTIVENQGSVQTDMRLKTILVSPTKDLKDVTVTRAIF